MPKWFEQFGLNGTPHPPPHYSWFKIAQGSLFLSGAPDEILQTPEGRLIIIDYKTARFKTDDPLRPLYEAQLNVYARIAERLSPPREIYPNIVDTLGLMYYDPLTEEINPDKISPQGFLMEFHAHWVPLKRRDAWIDELLARAEEILSKPKPPEGAADCKTCKAYHSIAAALPRIW
jgi:RecB family exonuclease